MANLLERASIVLSPTAYNNGEVLCVKPDDASGDFDFSRATESTRINSLGLVEVVADNLPRINYEGGCGSWLFEPQSTNLVTYSEDFENYFNISEITLNSNYAISPDGTLNANKVTFPSTSNSMYKSGISYSGTHTISFWYKGEGSNIGKTFNVRLFSSAAEQNTKVTLESGWKRFESQNNGLQIFEITNRNTTTIGTGSLLLYGFQIEAGSFPTSYIPTDGTSVTRNQDACTNGGSVSTINSTEGVFYAEIASLTQDDTFRLIGLNDGSTQNRVNITYNNQTNELIFSCRVNNVNEFLFTKTLADTTSFHKCALLYKLNEFKVFIDGVQENTQLSGSTFPENTLDKLDFDIGNGGFPFFGKTKCLAVWKETLTDTELAELTTI